MAIFAAMPDRLPPAQLSKPSRILGMLGSSHDGEVLAAGRAADHRAPLSGAEPEPATPWQGLVSALPWGARAQVELVEKDFLGSLMRKRKGGELSDRQEAKLRETCRKCQLRWPTG